MTENLEQKASFDSFINRLRELRRKHDSKELDADATFIELARLDEEFEESPYYDNEDLADQFCDIYCDLYNECSEEMEFSEERRRMIEGHKTEKIASISIDMTNIIGFTTGSLYRSGIPFEKGIRLYHSLGAAALELSFATPDELLEYQLSGQAEDDIKKYGFVSIHAPWKGARYAGSTTDDIIEKLSSLCKRLPVDGIVLHPDTIDDYEKLNESGLPFLLENMDSRKKQGIYPEEFEKLKERYNFGFVLDVQHSYEHDPNMRLAEELIEVMGDRLSHMHVSGCTESEIHVPVHLAANKEAITEILELGINVPKVLEGILLEDIEETIKNELEYAGKYERK